MLSSSVLKPDPNMLFSPVKLQIGDRMVGEGQKIVVVIDPVKIQCDFVGSSINQ